MLKIFNFNIYNGNDFQIKFNYFKRSGFYFEN